MTYLQPTPIKRVNPLRCTLCIACPGRRDNLCVLTRYSRAQCLALNIAPLPKVRRWPSQVALNLRLGVK